MPRRTDNQKTGSQAEAFVAKAVADMGFLWHARHEDYGIDGEIEIVDRNGEVTGSMVCVQIKGTANRFSGETEDLFSYTIKAENATYWERSSLPVLLVCVSLARQQAWWKCLDDVFADPRVRSRRTIVFDKSADRFGPAGANAIAAVATPPGVPLPMLSGEETLTTNLLLVERFAPLIYSAPTFCEERADAWSLMDSTGRYEGGFMLSGGRIFSFSPLDAGALAVLVSGAITSDLVDDWANSEDFEVRNRFVRLLNSTLRAMHHEELEWHRDKKVLFYRANPELTPTRVRGRSPRSRGRTFFSVYRSRDEINKVRYCRHYAADLRFRYWEGCWYLEINPTYHFTIDGKRDSLFEPEYISKVKRFERNRAVLALVTAWADLLSSRRESTLLRPGDERIVFGKLATVTVDAVIDEKAWTVSSNDSERDATTLEMGA
jgi:hypothetical protein